MSIHFPTDYNEIVKRMEAVDPQVYARTRNYVDGAVSYLSPYLSRGVLSTRQVYLSLRARGFDLCYRNQDEDRFLLRCAERQEPF